MMSTVVSRFFFLLLCAFFCIAWLYRSPYACPITIYLNGGFGAIPPFRQNGGGIGLTHRVH
jgi:hypothetical protein